MRQKGDFKMSVGIPSLLMIFVVLCLTTFAVLSFVSARADLNVSDQTVQTAQGYYAADHAAQQALARLDKELYQAQQSVVQLLETGSFSGLPCGELSGAAQQELSQLLASSLPAGQRANQMYLGLLQALAPEEWGTMTLTEDGNALQGSFAVPVGDGEVHELRTTYLVRLGEDGTRYEIAGYELVNIQQWEAGSGLDVWQGPSQEERN